MTAYRPVFINPELLKQECSGFFNEVKAHIDELLITVDVSVFNYSFTTNIDECSELTHIFSYFGDVHIIFIGKPNIENVLYFVQLDTKDYDYITTGDKLISICNRNGVSVSMDVNGDIFDLPKLKS